MVQTLQDMRKEMVDSMHEIKKLLKCSDQQQEQVQKVMYNMTESQTKMNKQHQQEMMHLNTVVADAHTRARRCEHVLSQLQAGNVTITTYNSSFVNTRPDAPNLHARTIGRNMGEVPPMPTPSFTFPGK